MENNKHFSHTHILILHQMPPHENETLCSGCKLQATGTVYVCWQCSFFLHEQCFMATRSFRHPSHPDHPLNLIPYPTYPSSSFYCNSCHLVGTGLAYCCSDCEFDIHVHCAYQNLAPKRSAYENPSVPNIMPISPNPFPYNPHQNHSVSNNIPKSSEPFPYYQPHSVPNNMPAKSSEPIPQHANMAQTSSNEYVHNYHNHQTSYMTQTATPPLNEFVPKYHDPNFHPQWGNSSGIKHFTHDHALHLSEIRKNQIKVCSGCEENITGSAYICKNSKCNFNLHKSCFELPREIRHNSHPKHPLTLLLSKEDHPDFTCNACFQDGSAFTYKCSICNFDLHVDCVSLPMIMKREDHKHPLTLFYYSPYRNPEVENETGFECDVCEEVIPDASWAYHCKKCDYGTHTYCVTSKEEVSVLRKSDADHISDSQKMMDHLIQAKIKHDSTQFILHHLI